MKIALNYDPETGNITDETGTYIGICHNLAHSKIKDDKDRPRSTDRTDIILKLKDAGFTADEIISMSSRGVV